ncbi:MAG: hypothetical protein HYZ42_02955 [Bacteroidetes bacterium]|nr:hypothetical protein [Bacteroidota bacterium]
MKEIKSSIYILVLAAAIASIGLYSCKKTVPPLLDYKRDIKFLVENISDYAKSFNRNFAIVVNDGVDLLTKNAEKTGALDQEYMTRINGIHINGLNFGPDSLDFALPDSVKNKINDWMSIATKNYIPVFVTDYSKINSNILDSYTKNTLKGYVPYVSNTINNSVIPSYPDTINLANSDSIFTPYIAKNYLLITNLSGFASKKDFTDSIRKTNYDMIIIDLDFNSTTVWLKSEIDLLKVKANGKRRLVLSYMSIGQAQTKRFYFTSQLLTNPPLWLSNQDEKNKEFYNIRYWDSDWQNIMFGSDDSYTRRIVKAGFDGAFLDRLTPAYSWWETK